MFDLDQSIANWRRQMIAAGIQTPAPLEELESHLREDIERRLRSGAAVADAFALATRQLGYPEILIGEFAKIGIPERQQMKKSLMILVALFGMVFGLAMILPALGQWHRNGVLRDAWPLVIGPALVIAGGLVSLYGIKTRKEARGRGLIALAIIAAGSFYVIPFFMAFFESRNTDVFGWIFCAALATASLAFFGKCFQFNRRVSA
jgi:hypothetical protein